MLLADKIGPVGPTAETVAIVALALLFAVILGGGCALLARLGQANLRADLVAAEKRARELAALVAIQEAQLEHFGPPVGIHRIPGEELTGDLRVHRGVATAYRGYGGEWWI